MNNDLPIFSVSYIDLSSTAAEWCGSDRCLFLTLRSLSQYVEFPSQGLKTYFYLVFPILNSEEIYSSFWRVCDTLISSADTVAYCFLSCVVISMPLWMCELRRFLLRCIAMDAGKPGTRQMLVSFSDSKDSLKVCKPIANVKKKKWKDLILLKKS